MGLAHSLCNRGATRAGVLVLYYVFMVSESEIWETEVERKREKTPLSDLISGPSGRNLLQVLVMMTGFWLTQNIITIFIPTTLLLHMLKLPKYALTSTLLDQLRGAFLQLYRGRHDRAADRPSALLHHRRPSRSPSSAPRYCST